ncbi:hypothetical protein ABH945_006309 [Paraburkholderia sp. GAS333]|uniref:hypothetical protein n=1 Tax=Paraburkholderia sp. GAS333 TaxID=3156279 RepID=UPI003D1A6213
MNTGQPVIGGQSLRVNVEQIVGANRQHEGEFRQRIERQSEIEIRGFFRLQRSRAGRFQPVNILFIDALNMNRFFWCSRNLADVRNHPAVVQVRTPLAKEKFLNTEERSTCARSQAGG